MATRKAKPKKKVEKKPLPMSSEDILALSLMPFQKEPARKKTKGVKRKS